MSLPLSPGLRRVLEIARTMLDHLSIGEKRVEEIWITSFRETTKVFVQSVSDTGHVLLNAKRIRRKNCAIARPSRFRKLAREMLALHNAERRAEGLITLCDVSSLSIERAAAVLLRSGSFDGVAGRYDPIRIAAGPLSRIHQREDWMRLAALVGPRIANGSEMIVVASDQVQATMSAHERLALAELRAEITDPELCRLLEDTVNDRVVIRRGDDLAVVAEFSKNTSCLLGVVDLAG